MEDLAARSGRAAIRVVSARQTGFELGTSPLWLEAEIRQLELDRQLFECLPEVLQDQWRKYRPEGRINADVTLHFDVRTKTWHPDLSVECLNVALTHYKFPYRLEHGTGSLPNRSALTVRDCRITRQSAPNRPCTTNRRNE